MKDEGFIRKVSILAIGMSSKGKLNNKDDYIVLNSTFSRCFERKPEYFGNNDFLMPIDCIISMIIKIAANGDDNLVIYARGGHHLSESRQTLSKGSI